MTGNILPAEIICNARDVSAPQNYDQALAYVGALTGMDPAAVVMDWRAISDRDAGVPAIPFRGTLPEVWNSIVHFNNQNYGIFCGINQLDGVGRQDVNVTAIRSHVIDLDNLSARQNYDRAAAWSPAPSFAVQSSLNKFHVYFPVVSYVGHDLYRKVQRKLSIYFDSDKSIIDPARVLRLPGTYHCKRDPVLVTFWLLEGYKQPLTVETLEAALVSVNVVEGASGRHLLGDPALAAPSLYWASRALELANPNDMDRPVWLSFSAAYKQAAWSRAAPDVVLELWLNWCERYDGNDVPTNMKAWNSITATEIGWSSLLRRSHALNADFQLSGMPVVVMPMTDVGLASSINCEPSSSMPPSSTGPIAMSDHFLATATIDKVAGSLSPFEVVQILNDARLNVAFDEFKNKITITGRLPWDIKYPRGWTDLDNLYLQTWLNAHGHKPSEQTCAAAIQIYADLHRFNPVVDWITGLQWDGVPRLDMMLIKYFNATNLHFAFIVSPKMLIAMIARALQPGCKHDCAAVLEGAQGIGKSTALRILAGADHFSDQLPNLRDKEGLAHLNGLWLVEIAELAAMQRSQVEEIKVFLAARIDRFRPPYRRLEVEKPRTACFVGSTNLETYLQDGSGNRRFWPIKCGGPIDVDGLVRDRDQLFAEALYRYRKGERWHLSSSQEVIAHTETSLRFDEDAWAEPIANYCEGHGHEPITMEQIRILLQIPYAQQHSGHARRIASILKNLGYTKKRATDRSRAKYWVRTHADVARL